MNSLWDVPIESVVTLTPERAVDVIRATLRAECGYGKLSPSALTISNQLMAADGGIDAEINVPNGHTVPTDCIFQSGLTGIQIKSGATFKPWRLGAIRKELLNRKGSLCSEVERLVKRQGRYTLICTGHDLTPQQRNKSRQHIADVLEKAGFGKYEERVDVLSASQVAEFAERYPGVASLLTVDSIQEALTLEEWRQDAHMANEFEESPEQAQLITDIRTGLQGETKHIRVLGEAGLGKTRIVLEAVKDENIAPYVLYIQHGSQFGQTGLFRQLLKSGRDKPLTLVIDELPESELSDIWRHLKPRCGHLKIISLDHGRDDTHDEEIDRLEAPRLSDEIIKKILASRVGESRELYRWIEICEGSPRVAQAVADNLHANPADILKSPATIPIWTRFLHGYGNRDETGARQVDCVAQHLALFSRFGYEDPVGDEAEYIAKLIKNVDPTIGWARFQEIVKNLRERRVLQGSRTLFFVPKALHIYLWKQFWKCYGRGFDFAQTFDSMPKSLHVWFMSMFKYAGDTATAHIIDDILKSDGIFYQPMTLTSEKGSRFLSILAEASPIAVLRLLETTIGKWGDDEILSFSENRQNLVWTLGKIVVWSNFTVRAMQLLARLAVNENAGNGNNATGTLIGLFRIGPEWAVTGSTPEARLPVLLKLLRASSDAERHLGLKAMEAALDRRGMGLRIVGPEYQGLKERAKLWEPATYDEWWQASFIYFQALVDETRRWPITLRPDVCSALLDAIGQQIKTPPCTELAFQVLNILVNDSEMLPEKLNRFFWYFREHESGHTEVAKRLSVFERRFTRRNLASRFQRYVIDVEYSEWLEGFREQHNRPKSRAKALVKALACRIARHPEKFSQIQHLITPTKDTPALCYFSEQIAQYDEARALLPAIIQRAQQANCSACLCNYLLVVKTSDPEFYRSTVNTFLDIENSAWLGAAIVLCTGYDDGLFVKCLDALEKRWIAPRYFARLWFDKSVEPPIPPERTKALLCQLSDHESKESLPLLIDMLDSIPLDDSAPFDSEFVFGVISRAVPSGKGRDVMRGYTWKSVCLKLIAWDMNRTLPL